jgi:hypothetical protein
LAFLDGLGDGLRDATGARERDADTDGTTCARDGDGDCDAATAGGLVGDGEADAAACDGDGEAEGAAADTDGDADAAGFDADAEADAAGFDADAEADGAGFDADAEADGTGEDDDDADGRTADADGVADGTAAGLREAEAGTPPEHCMDRTNEPVTVLNPSTEIMWCPVFPVTPDITEFKVLEVQLAELSDNCSDLNMPSVKRRMTVSMLLPHVLNV